MDLYYPPPSPQPPTPHPHPWSYYSLQLSQRYHPPTTPTSLWIVRSQGVWTQLLYLPYTHPTDIIRVNIAPWGMEASFYRALMDYIVSWSEIQWGAIISLSTFSQILTVDTSELACLGDHYSDVIMSMMVSQVTSLTIAYSTVYSGIDQRKHQSSTSLAFVRGIHRLLVNSRHKGPVKRKMFPFDDVAMGLWVSFSA